MSLEHTQVVDFHVGITMKGIYSVIYLLKQKNLVKKPERTATSDQFIPRDVEIIDRTAVYLGEDSNRF